MTKEHVFVKDTNKEGIRLKKMVTPNFPVETSKPNVHIHPNLLPVNLKPIIKTWFYVV